MRNESKLLLLDLVIRPLALITLFSSCFFSASAAENLCFKDNVSSSSSTKLTMGGEFDVFSGFNNKGKLMRESFDFTFSPNVKLEISNPDQECSLGGYMEFFKSMKGLPLVGYAFFNVGNFEIRAGCPKSASALLVKKANVLFSGNSGELVGTSKIYPSSHQYLLDGLLKPSGSDFVSPKVYLSYKRKGVTLAASYAPEVNCSKVRSTLVVCNKDGKLLASGKLFKASRDVLSADGVLSFAQSITSKSKEGHSFTAAFGQDYAKVRTIDYSKLKVDNKKEVENRFNYLPLIEKNIFSLCVSGSATINDLTLRATLSHIHDPDKDYSDLSNNVLSCAALLKCGESDIGIKGLMSKAVWNPDYYSEEVTKFKSVALYLGHRIHENVTLYGELQGYATSNGQSDNSSKRGWALTFGTTMSI
ncbi:hypothetical protein [Candidatus Sneabacter namystus]|uniref:Uncharacterized protein n=1 Tax=Candidatus Sneabacter namystus TaxID=2601646 RepID=A0A5C0UJ79_9RICK|nr:hypothetical protein [Candidatus Sneabacter namystus]QEK39661.1 hypothetical protein FZC37_01800 [Candidatus Sneabacter namystus]